MLSIVQLDTGQLTSFELGDPLDPKRDPEAHLRWVLADYDARRDEQWKVSPPEGEPILCRILLEAGEDAQKLIPVIRALGFFAMPDYGPTLVARHVQHPDRGVQLAAIRALGSMGAHESVAYLWAVLEDPDPDKRYEAVVSIGKIGIPALLPRIEHEAGRDPRLVPVYETSRRKAEAAEVPDLEKLVDAVIETDGYEDLGVLMPYIWKEVTLVLGDPRRSEIVRARAVRLLGLTRQRKSGPMCLIPLNDPATSPAFRLEVVIAVGRMRYRKAVPALIDFLKTPDPVLQDAVITALGEIGDSQAFEPLLTHYGDRGGAVRERARLALRRIAPPHGIEDHVTWSSDPSDVLPLVRAVYWFDDDLSLFSGVRPEVIDARLADPRPEVRREAALLLALVGQHGDAAKLSTMAQLDDDDLTRKVASRARRVLLAKEPPDQPP